MEERWVEARTGAFPDEASSPLFASVCLAGDSAAYQRTNVFGDNMVIVAAHRIALCKAKFGGFKDTHLDDLLAAVLKAMVEKTNLNPGEVGDIVVGMVLAPGTLRATEYRMASFYAGFPDTVPIRSGREKKKRSKSELERKKFLLPLTFPLEAPPPVVDSLENRLLVLAVCATAGDANPINK
ncbi:hypothetical protein FNV43_RR03576 [Rhamnella rubrinervis]|uniref:Thiolase N-terminal domain-containing protein n=1 Tax=Rhamnella rubrinervis TaxID=2594499 RepID=A0A8K0MNT9_9ROSA|nr:hypothetical protein FNV43_RR03576 [Rhamnella rubrinervis]